MVVSPSELKGRIETSDAADIKRLEKEIDMALKCGFDGSMFTFSPNNYPSRVVKAVLAKYRTAGWKVKEHYDQKDGDYITFE